MGEKQLVFWAEEAAGPVGERAHSRRLRKARWLQREMMGSKFEEVDRREVI